MDRKAKISRKTSETNISMELNLDGTGVSTIELEAGFWRHMMTLLFFFSRIDACVVAKGDLDVDDHHTVEDLGISFGAAVKQALGDRSNITRFGTSLMPMDETLVQIALDISGRPYLGFHVPVVRGWEQSVLIENTQEFLRAFVNHAGITLHVKLFVGENTHHICEAIFKGLGLALRKAVKPDLLGVPSTKGSFD
ncbi:MAG: imidazoleglycerol-phosphate dehydratase HisB [Candidatus Ratteibacteria bacterium]|jgi:imidazoleglycerol-phosphate dehydratase